MHIITFFSRTIPFLVCPFRVLKGLLLSVFTRCESLDDLPESRANCIQAHNPRNRTPSFRLRGLIIPAAREISRGSKLSSLSLSAIQYKAILRNIPVCAFRKFLEDTKSDSSHKKFYPSPNKPFYVFRTGLQSLFLHKTSKEIYPFFCSLLNFIASTLYSTNIWLYDWKAHQVTILPSTTGKKLVNNLPALVSNEYKIRTLLYIYLNFDHFQEIGSHIILYIKYMEYIVLFSYESIVTGFTDQPEEDHVVLKEVAETCWQVVTNGRTIQQMLSACKQISKIIIAYTSKPQHIIIPILQALDPYLQWITIQSDKQLFPHIYANHAFLKDGVICYGEGFSTANGKEEVRMAVHSALNEFNRNKFVMIEGNAK